MWWGASTSLASPGSAPPQAKMLKLAQEHFGLAHKLLTVSNRTTRVLEYLYLFDRVVDTDLFAFALVTSWWSRGAASPETTQSYSLRQSK